MKKVVIGIISAVLIGLIVGAGIINNRPSNIGDNVDEVFAASDETGWIGEKIIGDVSDAKVVIYEYADFGCSHCASWNKVVNEIIEKYGGEVAVVFRCYDLGFQNGAFAARAATAAQLQGYFEEYKNLLFSNQAEWMYESGGKLGDLLAEYFVQASDGKGDIEKFRNDMKSGNVRKRLSFEQMLGKKVELSGTPLFRIDGKNVPANELNETVERLMTR